jgi:hypothetical protein
MIVAPLPEEDIAATLAQRLLGIDCCCSEGSDAKDVSEVSEEVAIPLALGGWELVVVASVTVVGWVELGTGRRVITICSMSSSFARR